MNILAVATFALAVFTKTRVVDEVLENRHFYPLLVMLLGIFGSFAGLIGVVSAGLYTRSNKSSYPFCLFISVAGGLWSAWTWFQFPMTDVPHAETEWLFWHRTWTTQEVTFSGLCGSVAIAVCAAILYHVIASTSPSTTVLPPA